MAKTESKRMRSALHYLIEFLVILLGITVSVTIEKNSARQYKREVKDQGLTRILANIEQDSLDFVYNIRVHTEAETSCRWMVTHRDQLPEQHPDTIGKHCNLCIMGQTILVDNQEEYRTLQNSGLFEFIENDALGACHAKQVRRTHRPESGRSVHAGRLHKDLSDILPVSRVASRHPI